MKPGRSLKGSNLYDFIFNFASISYQSVIWKGHTLICELEVINFQDNKVNENSPAVMLNISYYAFVSSRNRNIIFKISYVTKDNKKKSK